MINARDVTLQRRTEELFQHAQKLESVGRLAGGIAHDFNNLLTVILSGTHELKHNARSGTPIDPEILDDVEAAGERARTLTRQLLAFARKQVVAPVALDLNDVVKGSEALFASGPGRGRRVGSRTPASALDDVLRPRAGRAGASEPRRGACTTPCPGAASSPSRLGTRRSVALKLQEASRFHQVNGFAFSYAIPGPACRRT